MDGRNQSPCKASSHVGQLYSLHSSVNRWPNVKTSQALSKYSVAGFRQHIGASVCTRCTRSARHLGLSSTREGTQVLHNPFRALQCPHDFC